MSKTGVPGWRRTVGGSSGGSLGRGLLLEGRRTDRTAESRRIGWVGAAQAWHRLGSENARGTKHARARVKATEGSERGRGGGVIRGRVCRVGYGGKMRL